MKSSAMNQNQAGNINVPAPSFHWGTRVVLPIAILLAFGSLFAGSMISSLKPVAEVEVTPVIERPAIKKSVEISSNETGNVIVQAAGWIEPAPFPVYATTLTDGTVEEVLFLEGESVEKGEFLARLIDDDALLDLKEAEAEYRAAEEIFEANIERVRDAAVAKATVEETKAAWELARAELDIEKAMQKEAQLIFNRRKDLVDDGTISQEDYDTAEAKATAQDARVRVVEQRIEELEAKLKRMKAEEEAADKHLDLRIEERRDLELAEVAYEKAKLRVERLEIRAPIDGVVMERMIEPGSMMMAMSENAAMSKAAALYDPKKLQVRVDVPLADAAKIGVGQPAQIIVEVLPDQTFTGTVSRITNLADIQKNTLEVKVDVENPAPELKPEMLARVRFLSVTKDSADQQTVAGMAVFAPSEIVANDSVWVVSEFDGEEGIASKRSITKTGAEKDGWAEIESGLQPGDLLIVSSPDTLKSDQPVRIRTEGIE